MTIPGLPPRFQPDAPPPPLPSTGLADPPLIQRLPDGRFLVKPMVMPEDWGQGYAPPAGGVWDDSQQINAAAAAAGGNSGRGGAVVLGPWDYSIVSGIVLPQQSQPGQSGFGPVSMHGVKGATRLLHSGTGACVFMHRVNGYGGSGPQNPAQVPVGALGGILIDGTNAAAGAIGLDWGDGLGNDIDVEVQNYILAGSIGVLEKTRHFFTEKARVYARILNCDTAYQIDSVNGGTISHEYCDRFLHIECSGNGNQGATRSQTGLLISGGANVAGRGIYLSGNMSGSPNGITPGAAYISITGAQGANFSQIFKSELWISVEGNNTGPYPPLISYGSASNAIIQTSGRIWTTVGTSQLNGGEFSFSGTISGDTALSQGWPSTAFPGLGVAWANTGPDALVIVEGGTISSIQIAGQTTGATSGLFPVKAGGALTVNGTVAPTTFNVVPASQISH